LGWEFIMTPVPCTDDFLWVVVCFFFHRNLVFIPVSKNRPTLLLPMVLNPVSSQEKGKGKGNKGGGRRMEWSVQHHDNWDISSDLFKRLPFLVAKWDAGCVLSHVWLVVQVNWIGNTFCCCNQKDMLRCLG